jgi:hypothetical protein
MARALEGPSLRVSNEVCYPPTFPMVGRYFTPAFVTILCLSAVLFASCRDLPVGPSLSAITVSNLTTQPTAQNPDLCCCRIVGTATNNNSASVHVSITISAFDNGELPKPLASLFFIIQDLQPNTSQQIDAAGFAFPCSLIKRLEADVHVTGIPYPPV